MNFKWNYCVPSSFDVSKTNKLSYNLYFYNFERAEKCVANYFFQKVSWNLTILQNTYKDCWHIYASLVKHSNEVRGHSSTTWTKFCRFLTPPPLRGLFLYLKWGKKQAFFDPLSPHLVHVVIEWPLRCIHGNQAFWSHQPKWTVFSATFPIYLPS